MTWCLVASFYITCDCCVQVYATIHDELVSGGRVYIVCPLVSENEGQEGVRAATEEHERLQASGLFGDFKCGLLHGKMKGEEKAAVLKAFNMYVSWQPLVSLAITGCYLQLCVLFCKPDKICQSIFLL